MSYKGFGESRLRFLDSLNGQRWIFLKKGLDDFRDGFPPPSDKTIVYGRKRPISITLQNSALKSSSTVLWEKRTKSSKTQVCLSKLSPLQRVRRDYVARMERCLKQNHLVLHACLEKSTSPKLLTEDAGVPEPEVPSKSKAGYGVREQENQALQEVLHRMEDMQSKVTASKTRVRGRVSGGKPRCTGLSKKKVAGGEEEAVLTDFAPRHEKMKRAIKHYCDWVMSWGGGNCSMDEDTLLSFLNASCGREATGPSPFHAVNCNKVEAEKPKSQEMSPARLAVRSSHRLTSPPCQVKVPSQTEGEKIRYGAWYLDLAAWRKRQENELLKAPEATLNSLGNAKEGSEKEMEVTRLHSTQAFKEFLERKGYSKPRFLPKILSGGNGSRAPEKTSKACRNLSEEIGKNKRRFFNNDELIKMSKFSEKE